MTKTMKWVSITMLLLAMLQLPVARHQVLLAIVVCASGLLVVAQAVRAGKYPWAIGFFAIAVLFNPVMPIARSGRDVLWLNGIGLAAFLTAAAALKAGRARTVPSVTSRLPRREARLALPLEKYSVPGLLSTESTSRTLAEIPNTKERPSH